MDKVTAGWIAREQVDAITALLTELADEGWSIGTSQIIATHNLLLALNARPPRELTTAQLFEWIGPIVCKSEKQQIEFPIRLASCLNNVVLPDDVESHRTRRRMHRAFLFAIAALVIVAGVWFLTSRNRQTTDLVKPKPATPAPTQIPSNTEPVADTVNTNPLPVNPDEQVPLWPFAIAAAVLFSVTTYFVARARREHRLRKIFAADDQVRDYFPSVGAMPIINLEFRRAAQVMRRRYYEPGSDIDVIATVNATASAAGAFSPVFAPRARTPEYLVLIDQSTTHDIQAMLFENVTQQLLAYGVAADLFFFDGDPRVCWKAGHNAERFRFESIASSYSRHNLLIFTAGERFIDRLTDRPARWVRSFFTWFHDPTIFTPRPVMQWDAAEWMLARSGALILPASGAGIAAYIARSERAPQVSVDARGSLVPHLLEDDDEIWLSPMQPDRDLVRQLIRDLEIALGHPAMLWLAACAIYPGIDWAVLLFLGRELAIPQFEDNLLALARLPWFRHGHMPEWLRIRLLWTLSKPDELRIRTALFKMFDEAVLEKSGGQVRLAKYRDLAHALSDQRNLSEHVILDFMSARRVTPLNLSVSDRFALRVEEYFERHARREHRWLDPKWATLLLAYVPLVGLFLARSKDKDVRWHARMGILTTIVSVLVFIPPFWLLFPFWWPTLAIAIKRAPFNDRLRILMLARVADEPQTGLLRKVPPFSIVSFYNEDRASRAGLTFSIVILLCLTAGIFFLMDREPLAGVCWVTGPLYAFRWIRAWKTEQGAIRNAPAALLLLALGFLLGAVQKALPANPLSGWLIVPILITGGAFGTAITNHLRAATIAFATTGLALTAAVLDLASDVTVPLIILACTFALPTVVALVARGSATMPRTILFTAIALVFGWSLGTLLGQAFLMFLAAEAAFQSLSRNGVPSERTDWASSTSTTSALVAVLLSAAALLVILLPIRHELQPGPSSEQFLASSVGALGALICFRFTAALRIALAMGALATICLLMNTDVAMIFVIVGTALFAFCTVYSFALTLLLSVAWESAQTGNPRWCAMKAALYSAMPIAILSSTSRDTPIDLQLDFTWLTTTAGTIALIAAFLAWRMSRAPRVAAVD